jgi:vitamin B12 transporter
MYRGLLGVLLSMAVCSSAFAAEPEQSPVVMDEVVVTAGRVVEKVQDQTVSVTIIDADEIAESPARDLGDLLAEKGIGYIQKNPGALTTVAIRGFRTNAQTSDLLGYSLVLLNGRRAGTGNMAMILTRDVERIEIVRGPGAVQYGSAAMGGVINIITRQGAGPLSAKVFGGVGSFGFVEGGGLLSGETEKFDYSVSYARSTMDDYRTADGDKYRNTGFDSKESYSLSLGYRLMENHRFGLMLNGTKIDKVGTPNYLSQNDLDDYRDSDYQAIDFSYNGETTDGSLAWELRLFETETEDKSYDPVASNPDFWDDGGLSFKSKIEQTGAQAQIASELDLVRLVTGVDWYDYDVKSTFSPNHSTFETLAGFVLAKSRFFDDRLIVDAGLRYEYAEVEMLDPDGNTEDQGDLISSFGVAYLLNDHLKVRAHFGEAFKMPGADQLAADYTVDYGWGPIHYSGNPDLDHETSRTYEVGIDYVDKVFSASLGYFYTRFKDKITQVLIPAGYSWENSGKSEISGVEAQLSSDFVLWGRDDLRLQPYLNFTYFDRYRDLDNHEDLKYINEMNASYGFGLKMPYKLSARLNFAYQGRKWIDDWESAAWPNPVEVVEKGGFTVADLSVSQLLLESRCTIRASVANLFNKDYSYVEGYPMPERNYQVNLSYRF